MATHATVRELERRLDDLADRPAPSTAFFATGVPSLDRLLPGGGLPRGQAIEWRGPRSSGKTALLRHVLQRLAASGEAVALVDAHATLYAPDWERVADVSPRFWALRPGSPGEALRCTDLTLRSGAFGAVALLFRDKRSGRLERSAVVRLQRLAEEENVLLVVESRCPVAGLRLRFEPERVEPIRETSFGPQLPRARLVWARVAGAGRTEVPVLCPVPGTCPPARDGCRDRKGRR